MKKVAVVAGVIFKNGKVLCVQRGNHKLEYVSNKFEFPGGKIQPNEAEQRALQRELLEELNLNVVVGEKIMTVNHKYPDFEICMQCYKCTTESSNIELREHISMRYMEIKDLLELDWLEADIPVVKYLMKDFK